MYNRENQEINLVWITRFITAAIAQGAIVVGLTIFIIFREISILKPGVSRVLVTGGGAGTWFTLGYDSTSLLGQLVLQS